MANVDTFLEAIRSRESNNRYNAKGALIKKGMHKGTRAFGAYQFMPTTYREWAPRAGVDPNDTSPAAQDKVARRYAQHLLKIAKGNPEKAARGWLGGPGAINRGSVGDRAHKNVNTHEYGKDIARRMGISPAAAKVITESNTGTTMARSPRPKSKNSNRNGVFDYGDYGEDVARLQRRIGVEADGIYGKETEAAIRKFQGEMGLEADGIAGKKTHAAMKKASPLMPERGASRRGAAPNPNSTYKPSPALTTALTGNPVIDPRTGEGAYVRPMANPFAGSARAEGMGGGGLITTPAPAAAPRPVPAAAAARRVDPRHVANLREEEEEDTLYNALGVPRRRI